MSERRVRVTLEIRAVPNVTLFRWLLGYMADMHQTAPGRVRFTVQVLASDDEKP